MAYISDVRLTFVGKLAENFNTKLTKPRIKPEPTGWETMILSLKDSNDQNSLLIIQKYKGTRTQTTTQLKLNLRREIEETKKIF